MFGLFLHSVPTVFTPEAKGAKATKADSKKQARARLSDEIWDRVGGRDGEGWGEMDGPYFREQRESDGRSGLPMGLVSVNNLHINVDSFK